MIGNVHVLLVFAVTYFGLGYKQQMSFLHEQNKETYTVTVGNCQKKIYFFPSKALSGVFT